ncbi:EfeM/EfeO family lipoprotein [Actinacidiphila acidipaludis]|uniref:EfeM/EfeO family lipoprotein n=1 Tax=Actinacidiphila acidipaludis TaxID=2873382 RepID=UPI0027E17CA6|nr:EfeM/EfeO family lipoprotein [Streptomyces acidipaludis]
MSAESDTEPASPAAAPEPEPIAEADGEPGGIAAASPTTRSLTRRRVAPAAGAVVAVAAAVTAAVLAGGGGGHGGDSADGKGATATQAADGLPHTAIDVSTGGCGRGWGHPHAGTQVFDLHNSGSAASEVYLSDPKSGKLYGELEGLAPGTTRQMLVDLGSGTYAFKCLPEDTDAVTGPSVTVPGHQPQGAATLPVTQHDLIPPTLAYQQWIGARMGDLARGTGTLKADIDRGDLAAAKRDWLSAHLVYERMGAAYGTFGDADGAINGTAARTPGAVDDASFAGFHRVEYGLWHGQPAAALKAPAAELDKNVGALRDGWSQARMDPAEMGLRAHEIIENTEQFELTGRTDYGSGTNLATARANLDGTREILSLLRPLLTPRDPALPRLDSAVERLQHDLDAAGHGDAWTPLDRLGRAQREQINADTGDLLEQLAPVAAIFDVRRTA